MTSAVSVVIPAFNAEPFLAAAIESALSQTHRPTEVLVVDDGSTDGTAAVAASYGGPVTYLYQANAGVSAARNRGIRVARGEFVGLLDADDEWERDKLALQLDDAAGSGAVASFTGAALIRDGRRVGRIRSRASTDVVRQLLLLGPIVGPPSGALIRRDTLIGVGGFDTAFSQCADWDMWMRIALAGPIRCIDEPLVRYRVHGGNMSRSVRRLEIETMQLLAKYRATEPYRSRYVAAWRRATSNHYGIIAGSYLHAGDPSSAVRCAVAMVLAYPPNVRRLVGLPLRWALRALGSRA